MSIFINLLARACLLVLGPWEGTVTPYLSYRLACVLCYETDEAFKTQGLRAEYSSGLLSPFKASVPFRSAGALSGLPAGDLPFAFSALCQHHVPPVVLAPACLARVPRPLPRPVMCPVCGLQFSNWKPSSCQARLWGAAAFLELERHCTARQVHLHRTEWLLNTKASAGNAAHACRNVKPEPSCALRLPGTECSNEGSMLCQLVGGSTMKG